MIEFVSMFPLRVVAVVKFLKQTAGGYIYKKTKNILPKLFRGDLDGFEFSNRILDETILFGNVHTRSVSPWTFTLRITTYVQCCLGVQHVFVMISIQLRDFWSKIYSTTFAIRKIVIPNPIHSVYISDGLDQKVKSIRQQRGRKKH